MLETHKKGAQDTILDCGAACEEVFASRDPAGVTLAGSSIGALDSHQHVDVEGSDPAEEVP